MLNICFDLFIFRTAWMRLSLFRWQIIGFEKLNAIFELTFALWRINNGRPSTERWTFLTSMCQFLHSFHLYKPQILQNAIEKGEKNLLSHLHRGELSKNQISVINGLFRPLWTIRDFLNDDFLPKKLMIWLDFVWLCCCKRVNAVKLHIIAYYREIIV